MAKITDLLKHHLITIALNEDVVATIHQTAYLR